MPHLFLDVLSPDEAWTAAEYATAVQKSVQDLLEIEKPIILAGGSTLHLSALVDGLSSIPDVPTDVRDVLERELEMRGLAALVAELGRVDPVTAARIDNANPRRVVRALEVYRHTGTPIAHFRDRRVPPPYRYATLYLRPPRDWLYARLDARVDTMVEQGLFDEVAALIERGVAADAPGLNSIGYREVVGALTGQHSPKEAIELVKRNTRRYAKRQYTYFDKYFATAFVIDPAHTTPDDAAIDQMLARG